MSLAKPKGVAKTISFAGPVGIGEVASKYGNSSPESLRPKRNGPSPNGDVVLEIAGHYDGEHHHSNTKRRRSKKYYPSEGGNCGGWLPVINTVFLLLLAIFLLVFYLNWNGVGGETTLARLESGNYLIPKTEGLMDDIRHSRHNHSRRIEFSVDAIPGQFTRYPEEGEYIDGLDPYVLVEHRLCCHINQHLFICDYGQGASQNMALECIVEYTKKGQAFLKIYIQSKEMSGAKCSFNWLTSEPKEVLQTTVKEKEVVEDTKKDEE